MYKEKLIEVPMYKSRVMFIATDDIDQLFEKRGLDLREDERPGIGVIYAHTFDYKIEIGKFKDHTCIFIIGNPNYKYRKFSISALVHEVVHVKNFMYRHLGIKSDLINDEPEAYLVDTLFKEAYEFYKKYMKWK